MTTRDPTTRVRVRRHVLHLTNERVATALGGVAVGGELSDGPYSLIPLLPVDHGFFPLILSLALLAPLLACRSPRGVGSVMSARVRVSFTSGRGAADCSPSGKRTLTALLLRVASVITKDQIKPSIATSEGVITAKDVRAVSAATPLGSATKG